MNSEKKILVVDDSRGWLNFHSAAINEIYGAEFIVETADSARMGYDMVYNNLAEPYELIITDMQMELDFEPLHAGEWFVEQIKKLNQYSNIPVIIVSATYNIKTIAENYGCNFLPKAIAARGLMEYKMLFDELLKK